MVRWAWRQLCIGGLARPKLKLEYLLVFLSAALVIQFELHLRAEKSSSSNSLSQHELRSSTLCLFHTRLCLGGPETTAGACRSTKVGSSYLRGSIPILLASQGKTPDV